MLSKPSPREIKLLSSKPLFQDVPEEHLLCFMEAAYVKTFPSHTHLLTMEQPAGIVFITLSGSVKVYIPQVSGQTSYEVILNIVGPGEILGELHAIDHKGHSASVCTLERTRCLCIRQQHFIDCLQKMPRLSYNLLQVVTERLRHQTYRSESLCAHDVPRRVAWQLLLLAERYGEIDEQGSILVPIHLTQHDLASLIGASRAWVNKVLKAYKHQGYISLDGDYMILHNPAELRQQCHSQGVSVV